MAKLKKLEVCMVIGDPIKHTLSPAMHNAGYKALGIDNRFVYIAERITKENLKSVLETAKASDIRGISVTVPHKQSVIKHLDSIDPVAKKIGAVNTIINDHGKLTGFNTDWIGATTALKKKVALKGKKTAVIGAGGAARAIVYGLKKNGAIVKIFNRSQERAKKLTQEFNCDFSKSNSLKELSNMDIIINASSVGMNEDESPIDKKLINKNHIVFDIVYSPKETRLITDAKEKGAKVILGYEMLLFQGMAQFQLFTGRKAPEKIMRKVLEDSL